MKRFLWLLIAILAGIVLVPFGLANRHAVPLTFDPFARLESGFIVEMPLSAVLFVAFMIGLLFGGLVTWMSQGKWRRTARMRTREAQQWRSEADRLVRERDGAAKTGVTALPAPSRGR